MSKILNIYENDLDRCWVDSSNIVYMECDDKTNELKVVRITFKNGSTYEYYDVKVQDYLMMREASSNGKAFFKYMKKYEYKRLEDKDVTKLNEELKLILEERENKLQEDLLVAEEEVKEKEEDNGDRGNQSTE